MKEWIFKKSDPYHWTLYHYGKEYFAFDDFSEIITGDTTDLDVCDIVDTGVEIMCNELSMDYDMDNINLIAIQDCMFSAICNVFNIHSKYYWKHVYQCD